MNEFRWNLDVIRFELFAIDRKEANIKCDSRRFVYMVSNGGESRLILVIS